MKPLIAVFGALVLGGCLHPTLFTLPKVAPAVAGAAKPVCPGSLSADLLAEPQPPKGAGFPAPQDQAASAAVTLYGDWLHQYAVWARAGWARAADAKGFCDTR